VDATAHLGGDVTATIHSYQTQVLKGHITMACKAKLAMKKLLARKNFFMRAASAKVLVDELVSRHGGSKEDWEKLVNKAVDNGELVFTNRGGVNGYRTMQSSERVAPSDVSPSLVSTTQMAVA
jgi:hypothetical protein